MGKSEKEILNNLSERADGFEMPVEDFVWDAIQKEVEPKNKKRRFGYWWMGLAGISLATAIFIAGYEFHDRNDIAEFNIEKELSSDTTHLNTSTFITGGKSIQKNTDRLSSQRNVTTKSTEEVELEKNDKGIVSNVKVSLTQNLVTTSIDHIASNSFEKNQSVENNQDLETNQNEQPGIDTLENIGVKSAIDQDNVVNSMGIEEDHVTLNRNTDSLIISIADAVIVERDSSKFEQDKDDLVVLTAPIEEVKKIRNFSLILHGGVGESFRILNSGTHFALIEHKNDHETFGGCFEVGLDAQFKFGNRFIGRTGVGYKFYSDKYDFQHDLIKHTTRNDYQYLQVPLILGFNVLPRPKSNLYLLGGMRMNLLTSAQSSWVDVDALAPVSHSNTSENTPFRSVTAAVNLGLDYNINLSDKFSVHIIPSVDAFLNSIYKRSTDLDQRPYSFNIDLGISYNF